MTNFDHTRVTPNRLTNAAANIDGSLGALANAFRAIEDALRGTLQPSWTGTVSDNFFAQYEIDALTFLSHVNALKDINTRLAEASGVYDRADNRAAELVANLKL